MGHDAVTPAEIDELAARNASIAEFPTTIEAAGHATQLGIAAVGGAPNILLGGSHSGNVAAEEHRDELTAAWRGCFAGAGSRRLLGSITSRRPSCAR